jgi:hypothetical protein
MRLLLFLHLLPVAFPLLSPLTPMPRGARASTPRLASRLASSPLDSPPPPASPPPGASDLAVAPPPELSRLFSTLAPAEQYSTTLLGICGKIVDGPAAQGGAARGDAAATSPGADSLGDCWLLLEEMCGLAHCASPRAASALLTATAASAAPQAVARSVSLLLRSVSPSGLSSSYGCYAAPVRVPRIRDPPPLPADDRAKEVTAAVSFLGALGTSLTLSSAMSASGADPLLPNAATVSLLSALFADNFYNIFSKLSTLFPKLPDLPPLPPSFPLGSGDLTRVLVAGLSRLATSDPSRDCRVEAAALVGAYKLGLPTFPFQVQAGEAQRKGKERKGKESEAGGAEAGERGKASAKRARASAAEAGSLSEHNEGGGLLRSGIVGGRVRSHLPPHPPCGRRDRTCTRPHMA